MKTTVISGAGLSMLVAFAPVQAEFAEQAWVARYDAPAQGKDNAEAVAWDAAGDVYVTGFSDSGGGNYDYATVKYNDEGSQLWGARYDGGSRAADWVRALAVDSSGNVVVTGSSAGEATRFDFATVKYDAAGEQLWVRRYDGPASGNDHARALAVDRNGNVYVTGESAGSGGRSESVTIKYNPNGELVWATRSGLESGRLSLAALALDGAGNVYVAGGEVREAGNSDYVTIKYDLTGKEIWTAHRDWSASDDARFLAVDASGNAYVTGASLRYTEGPEKTGHEDIATVKYAPDGEELWTASFNGGAGANDVVSSLGLGPGGQVYIAGTSYRPGADQIAVKYDTDGTELWSTGYAGPGGTEDVAHAAGLDPTGGFYVLGSERGGPGRKPWLVTVKFAADGSGQWVARHEGVATGGAQALAVDSEGSVWITGGDAGGQDFLTIKYVQSETEAGGGKAQRSAGFE